MNNNRRSSGGGRGGDTSGDRCEIGAYYEKMLNSEPMNSLLLTNYGKYLHEVPYPDYQLDNINIFKMIHNHLAS